MAVGGVEPTLEQILSRYGLERSALERRCTRDIGDHIFRRLDDWQSAGRCLGVPQEKIVAIGVENRTEDQRKSVLYDEWVQRNGKLAATCLRLAEALDILERRDLIEALCERIIATPLREETVAPVLMHKSIPG